MTMISPDEKQFKNLLKEALVELFEERQDWFSAIGIEALEDFGLTNAMDQVEKSQTVSKKEVIKALQS
jgi:hypothetical protein